MVQKYGYRASELADPAQPCEICGEYAGFNWSDLHGEGMCNRCGTPYDLKASPRTINVKSEWIPIIRQYWEETKQYMGLGQILIEGDYPECIEGKRKFFKWVGGNGLAPKEAAK